MSDDLHYSDEEIRRLLLQIKADQKPAPTPDQAPVQTKPVEVTARVSGITRELSIDEILNFARGPFWLMPFALTSRLDHV